MQVPTHTQIDTTELIRIVGHATDAVAGTRARLAAIIARICPLIGALCGAAAIARCDSGGAPPEFDCFASAGQWDDEARSAFENYVAKGWTNDPAYVIAMTRLVPGGGALHRAELISDQDWYNCDHFLSFRKPCGIDGSIYAIAPLSRPGQFIAMSYHEKLGTRLHPNATHAVRTLIMGLDFIGEAYFRELDARRLITTLTPRLRDILACYQLGMSAKQAAAKLGIKRSSVQQYSKSIHKHFNVNTRHELMAKCRSLRIELRLDDRPWAPNLDIDTDFAKVLFPSASDQSTTSDSSSKLQP